MYEASKAMKRRFHSGNFFKYFSGKGIDIGAGPDCVDKYKNVFGFESAYNWDLKDGDGQILASVADNTFDFLHSSHSLEHMVDPRVAVFNWVRVVKPGGYLIITVPEQIMYEKGLWPSQYNNDHKWSFTTGHEKMPRSINVLEFFNKLTGVEVIKIEKLEDFYYPTLEDLTMSPNPECAIEIILRKI
jgi:predicted SAM-dependent methyltransferase